MREVAGYMGAIGFSIDYESMRFSVTVQDIEDSGRKRDFRNHYFYLPEHVFKGIDEAVYDKTFEDGHGVNFNYFVEMSDGARKKLGVYADAIEADVKYKNELSFMKHEALPEDDIVIQIPSPIRIRSRDFARRAFDAKK